MQDMLKQDIRINDKVLYVYKSGSSIYQKLGIIQGFIKERAVVQFDSQYSGRGSNVAPHNLLVINEQLKFTAYNNHLGYV